MAGADEQGPGEGTVRIRLRAGRSRSATTLMPRGHATALIGDSKLHATFRYCAAHVVPLAAIASVLERLSRLNRVPELMDAVSSAVTLTA